MSGALIIAGAALLIAGVYGLIYLDTYQCDCTSRKLGKNKEEA